MKSLIFFCISLLSSFNLHSENINIQPNIIPKIVVNNKVIDDSTNRYFVELNDLAVSISKNSTFNYKVQQKDRRIQQNNFLKEMKGMKVDLKVLSSFNRHRNLIVTELSKLQYQQVKNSSKVKKIYRSYDLQINLAESVSEINADQVWDLNGIDSVLGTGITIAVIDTGVDYTHPDLGGCFGTGCKVLGGFDFVNNDNDPMDDNSHGTHVAGIVAANGVVRGIAPGASIMAYKACNIEGSCGDFHVMQAIEAAMDPDGNPLTDDKVDIINLSLGSRFGGPDDPLATSIDLAVDAGIMVVVAAGNNGPDNFSMGSVASARKALTVAAADGLTGIAGFSSRGFIMDNGYAKPEIAAPGVAINSTVLNQQYDIFSGTSQASPMVAGTAALLLSVNPGLTPEQLKGRLMATATDLNTGFNQQGTGIVNALKAIQVEATMNKSIVNLGWFDDQALMQQSQPIEIRNDSSIEQTFDLSITKTVENSLGFSLSNNQITLAPGGSKEISITIDFPSTLPLKPLSDPAYTAWLEISSQLHTSRMPITVLHTDGIIKVIFTGFNNHSKEIIFIEKQAGILDSVDLQDQTIPSVRFLAEQGEYAVIFTASSLDTFTGAKLDILPGQTVDFSQNDDWLPVNFELIQPDGTHLDVNGNLPEGTRATTFVVLPEYHASTLNGILGHEFPPLKLFLLKPTAPIFYDIEIADFIPFTNDKNIFFNDRLTLNDIQNDENFLFSYEIPLLRSLNFAYAPVGTASNNFTTEWDYLSFAYPLLNQSGSGGTYELDNTSPVSSELHSPRPPDFFSFMFKARMFANSNSNLFIGEPREEGDTKYISSQYHIDEMGNLALSDWNNTPTLLKTIELTEQPFEFKLGYLLPLFRGKLISDGNQFSMSYNEGSSSAFFADNLLSYYFGDVAIATSSSTGAILQQVRNDERQIVNGLFASSSILIPSTSTGSRYEFGSYVIDDIAVSLVAELDYDLNLTDFSPPLLTNLEINTLGGGHTHLADGNGEITVAFSDDMLVASTEIRIRPSGSVNWQVMASTTTAQANFQITDLSFGSYDLQVAAADSNGNSIVYTASPAFVSEAGCRNDFDCDGSWNQFDNDSDNDGVTDNQDAFPFDPTESVDTDNDGIGNNADNDDDGDGVSDSTDAFPLDATESVDTDNDGIGNNADDDDDGDGVLDSSDAFPLDPTRSQQPTPPPAPTSSSGGGSNDWFLIILLMLSLIARRHKKI